MFKTLTFVALLIAAAAPARAADVAESWESSPLQAVFNGTADRAWHGDLDAFAIEPGDWPDGSAIFGTPDTRAIRSTNASQSVGGTYTVLTEISEAVEADMMTRWSIYVSGNSISIQGGYGFAVVLAATTSDPALAESPDAATQGYRLSVSYRSADGATADYLTLWKSSATDVGWIPLAQVDLGSAWLSNGWNLLVTRKPNGEIAVSHATGVKGLTPELDFVVNDATVDLLGKQVYAGASWTTKGTSHANKFGFDDLRVESLTPPNEPPTADAGPDVDVIDTDADGLATVALDGAGSQDSDGSLVEWRWSKNAAPLATGPTPSVELAIGSHAITLEVIDDGGASDVDEVVVNVYPGGPWPPVAEAGADITVRDADGSGAESVTLDGTGSSDFGGQVVAWSWSDSGGELATGATPTIDLPVGVHQITLTVTDDSGLSASDTVTIHVNAVGPTTGSITQYGITWTFAEPVEYGQFVNGDWWVIAPVTISSVSPAPADGHHGSMLNPSVGDGQGYEIASNNYSAAAGVEFPITLDDEASLVSTVSWTDAAETHPDLTGHTISVSRIRTAAVLTVLNQVPPADAFRPPYSGQVKPIHRASQLRRELLPRLAPPSNDPDYDYQDAGILARDAAQTVAAQYGRLFRRPWLLHLTDWSGRSIHPTDNMPGYHREVYNAVSVGASLLLCDLEDIDALLIPFVQVGIDSYGVIASGPSTDTSFADSSINKWPVLLAGLLLDNAEMTGENYRYRTRWMSYYIVDGVSPYHSSVVPEGYTYNGYTVGWRQDPGTQEHEHLDPATEWDLVSDGGGSKRESYRRINSHTWPGICLAAHTVGAVQAWSDPAFFDYVDRWMSEDEYFPERTPHVGSTSSALVSALWHRYRYAGGDFDADGLCDATDIDLLARSIVAQTNPHFDLTGDGALSDDDLDALLNDVLETRSGDVNLDGSVDIQDFVALKQSYGSTDAGWSQGDFNGDQSVDISDFVQLKQNYGFSR